MFVVDIDTLDQNKTESWIPDFDVSVVYMSARRLAPHTSDYLMIGFEFVGTSLCLFENEDHQL